MEGYLFQPNTGRRAFSPDSRDVTDFSDFQWEVSSSLRNRWEMTLEECGGSEGRGGRGNWDWFVK